MNSIDLWTPTLDFAVSSTEFGPKGGNEEVALSNLRNGFVEEAKTIFEKIAKKQDGSEKKALFWLGMIAVYKEKNPLEGIQRLQEADSPESHYILGAFYLKGNHVEKDTEKGIEHLKRSADLGFNRARVELGAIYYLGLDGGNHKAKGQQLLKSIPNVTNISDYALQAMVGVDPMNIFRLTLPLNNKSLSLINQTAIDCWKNGKTNDAVRIWGLGIAKDESKLKPIQAKIYVNMGRHYYEKLELHRAAVNLWKPAAKQGNMHAQYYLGVAYCSGKGIKKNLEEGKKLLELSADAGFSPAQAMLEQIRGIETTGDDSTQDMDKDIISFSQKEKEDYIHSTKPFLNKAWGWLGKNAVTIGIVASVAAVGLSALGAVLAGAVVLTVFFPHVMIPIWVVGGGLVALSVGTLGLIGAGFAAGGH